MSDYGLQYAKAIYKAYNEKKDKSLAERIIPYQSMEDIEAYRKKLNPGNHNLGYPLFQKRIPRKLKKKLKKMRQFNYTPILKRYLKGKH